MTSMRGWLCAFGASAVLWLSAATTLPLLVGDAARGQALFRSQGCVTCHSLNGKDDQTARDLGALGGRGYSPAGMAALMWNHAPRMWAAMSRPGVSRPALSEQQAADLFAYSYAARYFDLPGDAGRGRGVFTAKRCAECHAGPAPGPGGARPVATWPSPSDPIALAQQLWNHSAQMQPVMAQKGIPYPELTARDLSDLLAYFGRLRLAKAQPAAPGARDAETGERLFTEKGCAGCHSGGGDFRTRRTRFSLTDFAAALWNHARQMPSRRVSLSYQEMRRIVGYLATLQFFEERGNPDRGQQVFLARKCGACHLDEASGAPDLAQKAGSMSSYGMVAALWKHGPAVLAQMRQKSIRWPRFNATEMADLTAYLHGPALKRR